MTNLEKFTSEILKILSTAQKVNLWLSGGSVANYWQETLLPQLSQGSNITIWQIDERLGVDAEFNQDKLFSPRLTELEITPHFIPKELTQIPTYIKQATQALTDENVINIGVFGVGTDLHTAGILPHEQEYTSIFHQELITVYQPEILDIQDKYKYRVTLNFEGITQLDHCFVYLNGKKKQEAYNFLTGTQELPLWEAPAGILKQGEISLTI